MTMMTIRLLKNKKMSLKEHGIDPEDLDDGEFDLDEEAEDL